MQTGSSVYSAALLPLRHTDTVGLQAACQAASSDAPRGPTARRSHLRASSISLLAVLDSAFLDAVIVVDDVVDVVATSRDVVGPAASLRSKDHLQ